MTMPRTEDPQVSEAGATIIALYPGADPSIIEEELIDPIEEVINELDDIKDMVSTAEDGLMKIVVEFRSGCDPDEKFDDVLQKISTVQNDLPDEMLSINVYKHETSDVKILQLALVSDTTTYRTLEIEADRLKKQLEKEAGIYEVETWAFPEQEIRVSLDLEKIANMKIPFKRVVVAIQNNNANIPGGNLDIGSRQFNIRTSGSYKSIEDIGNTIVHSVNGKIVYLKDIAHIKRNYEDQQHIARFKGRRTVFVTTSQKIGSNIFDVIKRLKVRISNYETQLPAEISLHYVMDQSESVAYRVNGFFLNLLQGVLLVGLVVFLAMSLRSSLIVMMLIPISILIALGFLDLSNYGLQQMSIAGLVIALGLLVDNAIVVTENVSRFLQKGYGQKEASVKGTSQIGWAIVSSTVTTVLAFVPIIMMRNVSGDFIRSMPITLVYTLVASLFVSLTLTPFLASKILKIKSSEKQSFGTRRINNFIENRYRKWLGWSVIRPKRVLLLSAIVFVGSFVLFPIVGVSYFPKAEKPQFLINIDTPPGTSLSKTDEVATYVESVLSTKNDIRHWATNVGRGNPRIYYNVAPKNERSNYAQIFVIMKNNDLEIFYRNISELRKEFSNYAGARIEVKEFEQGPGLEAPVAIKILGENLDIIRRLAGDVEDMVKLTPGTVNIRNPMSSEKTDLYVNINREKAGMLGIPLVDIDRAVRASINGLSVASYRDATGKEYEVVVRMPFSEKLGIDVFDKIYLTSYADAKVPLKLVANIEFKSGPMQIKHFNMDRAVTITSNVEETYSVNEATSLIEEKLKSYNFPKGYRYYIGGERESREESFGGLLKAVLVAMITILAVLVLQFRSYSQPLIVFASIPLAIIGSILALLITGYSFSFTAFVGITSLVGIVVNNSIILVDYTNQLRNEGKELLTALKEACETRFKPIVLTTTTTIGGLLPLTLGGGTLWAPMGWTIIGGLITSTVLTLIVVPVLYMVFTRVPNAVTYEPLNH